MRMLLPILWGLAAVPAPAPAQAPARPADEAAIRELIRSYVNARELKSPEAIGALFTADADQHTTGGEWRRGRAQVVPGTLVSSARNPGSRRITIETVRFLTPDTAIADGPYEITAPGGQTRRMWTTIVAAREAGRWRIAAIRNAIPIGGTAAP